MSRNAEGVRERASTKSNMIGMWQFWKKRHLRYPSIEAWIKGEGVPTPVTKITDPTERDRRITEYGELRQHLFDKHIKTLSAEERRQFKAGTHPSQSHRFADQVVPTAAALADHLGGLGFPATVTVGFYQMDRIVLDADLRDDPGDRLPDLPWLFRGFEVKYNWRGWHTQSR